MDNAIDLPDYIVARNAQALAAGLRIEKQALRPTDGSLTTWYVGSEQAWRASRFVPEGFVFPPKISLKAAVWAPESRARIHFPIKRQPDHTFLGSISGEPIPEHTQALDHGVTAYEFRVRSEHYIAYYGPRKTLVDCGIAPASAKDGSWGEASTWRSYLDGESLLFIKNLVAVQKQSEEAARPKPHLWYGDHVQSAADLRQRCARLTRVLVKSLTEGPVAGMSGEAFAMDPDSRAKIMEAVDDVCDVIQEARVLVRAPAKVAGHPLPLDPAFKRFLSVAVGNR